jgi:hypothetical protein
MIRKGLIVDVLREAPNPLFPNADTTNGGVSRKYNSFVLVGEGVPEVFEERKDLPALKLVKRNFGGRIYLHAEPFEKPEGHVGPMSGGNFVYSCDSRFPNDYPISIHDRFETPEVYDMLSR